MSYAVNRRALLKTGAATLPMLPLCAAAQERRFEPALGGWRSFELTTVVNVAEVKGATRVWLPVPDVEGDHQRPLRRTGARRLPLHH